MKTPAPSPSETSSLHKPAPLKIVVMVCDGLSPNYVGFLGNEWIETPGLDRLAHQGMVFDQCHLHRCTDSQKMIDQDHNIPLGSWRRAVLAGHDAFGQWNPEFAPTLWMIHHVKSHGFSTVFLTDQIVDSQVEATLDAFDTAVSFVDDDEESNDLPTIDDLKASRRFVIPPDAKEESAQLLHWRKQWAFWNTQPPSAVEKAGLENAALEAKIQGNTTDHDDELSDDSDWEDEREFQDDTESEEEPENTDDEPNREDAELGVSLQSSTDLVFGSALEWLVENRDQSGLVWLEFSLAQRPQWPSRSQYDQYLDDDEFQGPLEGWPGPINDEQSAIQNSAEDDNNPSLTLAQAMPSLRARYAAKVSDWDHSLEFFLDQLKAEGLDDNTLILVTSDRGWALGEHDWYGNTHPQPYTEHTQVPLVLRGPGIPTNRRSPRLVQPTDVFFTVLDWVGQLTSTPSTPAFEELDAQPIGWPTMGDSLVPLLTGDDVSGRDYICYQAGQGVFALHAKHWKLVLYTHPEEISNDGQQEFDAGHDLHRAARPRELYIKPEDRWDQNDVADQFLDVADHLELQLRRCIDAAQNGTWQSIVPMRENVLRQA